MQTQQIKDDSKPNSLQMVANPQILKKRKKRKKQTNKRNKKQKTKTQYMHPIHQVKQKLKSET